MDEYNPYQMPRPEPLRPPSPGPYEAPSQQPAPGQPQEEPQQSQSPPPPPSQPGYQQAPQVPPQQPSQQQEPGPQQVPPQASYQQPGYQVPPQSPPAQDPRMAPGAEGGSSIDRDAKQWAMFCHLAGLAVLLPVAFGLGGIIGTLVLWQIKKEEFPFVDEQGKEAVNFQISVLIYALICGFMAFLTFTGVFACVGILGIMGLGALALFNIICIVIGATSANDGKHYRYPLCIRFIK